MSVVHLEELERRFPSGKRERVLLRAFEGSPDPCGGAPDLDDPDRLKALYAALAELRAASLVLAYHDRSDGGLFVTLAEMGDKTQLLAMAFATIVVIYLWAWGAARAWAKAVAATNIARRSRASKSVTTTKPSGC